MDPYTYRCFIRVLPDVDLDLHSFLLRMHALMRTEIRKKRLGMSNKDSQDSIKKHNLRMTKRRRLRVSYPVLRDMLQLHACKEDN